MRPSANSSKLNNSGSKFSADELRNFYFSKASNYNNFNTKKKDGTNNTVKNASGAGQRSFAGSDGALSASDVNFSVMSSSTQGRALPTPVPAVQTPSPMDRADETTATVPAGKKITPVGAAGSALAAARANNNNNTSTTLDTTASAVSASRSADAVSPYYIEFLRQQQDLVKAHCSVDNTIQGMLEYASERRQAQEQLLDDAMELLHTAEKSSDWNWKSKFDADALATDAELEVPRSTLKLAEDIPNTVDLQHQQQLLVRLKQQYCTPNANQAESPVAAEFKPTLENGIRRFDRLIKEFNASQLDASPLVRISDDLLVQLDHVLSQQFIEDLLRDVNDRIAVIVERQRECQAAKDEAHEEGIMDVAELETYRLADIGEELANANIERVRILAKLVDECQVSMKVREEYSAKAQQAAADLEKESERLKADCERDLARLYTLKKQVDGAEAEMLERTENDRKASDKKLEEIHARKSDAWDQVAMLLMQIKELEAERHREIKGRMESKVRDETRRTEYAAFTNVSDAQARNYDRTIRNCDTQTHCTKLMGEFLHSGFFVIDKGLTQRKTVLDQALLDAQNVHLEVFRTLLFTLGDIEYRKDRRIEEVGENIQAAHIQQEMCSDSLNPNAKKFSDAKKEFLRLRDDLQLEVQDIRDRQKAASEQYEPTDLALRNAGSTHQHPIEELEDRRLNQRAKMVEYKEMAMGKGSSAPVRKELETLQSALQQSRRVIASRGGGNSSMQLIGN